MKPQPCRARVSAVRALAPEILEVELAMDEPADLAFDAGQWVSVPFGPKNVRAYSIASTPRSSGRITLCADVAPGGIGSAWFRSLAVGEAVEFKAPFGGFVFRRGDPRPPLFVAEEIGIVPIRAILADLEETGVEPRGRLVFWGRDPGWLPYHGELVELARRCPGFAYHPVVAFAGGGWSGATGEVDAAVDGLPSETRDLVAYVSGGGIMVDAVRETLMARGLDRKSIRWEKFW